MWQKLFIFICLCGYCAAGPLATSYQKRNMPIVPRENIQEQMPAEEESMPEATQAADMGTLTLPSNATSIRGDITDNFSCENRTYGYYADVENDCQIFHVCLPVTYADGKENIFRWSFICPEETIFSQESFTCMRREDMTTSCEESFKYYDLNRNFGSSEDESNKNNKNNHNNNHNNNNHNNRHQTANRRPEPSPIESEVEADKVQDVVKPVADPEPAVVKPQNVKAPKPNRRKPASSYSNQKKDSVPLRKAPQTTPHSLPVEEKPIINVAIVTEAEDNKPVPQRLNKKPASTITQTNKEKPQVNKSETAPIRIELYNQKRKRPSFMNKKDAAATTPKSVEQNNIDLKEPEPTLNLETMFVTPSETKKTTASEVVPDSNSDASESVVSISTPEQPVKLIENEDQPAHVETIKADVFSNNKKVSEPQASTVTIEDVKSPEAPLVAYEEIPAVIVEAEETKPEEDLPQPPKIVESNGVVDQQASLVVPSITESENSEAIIKDVPEVPAVVEPIQSGETHTIEALEAEKPVDAPESLPATSEMEQHSPMIEEVMDNNDDPHQTLGDFKPVDPEMAAEAEQLITEFLNTLRKNEENVQNLSEQSKPEIATPEKEESSKETANIDKVESIIADESSKNDSIEEEKLPEETQPQIIDPNVSVEEQDANEQVANVPELLKNIAPAPNVLLMNHLPPSIYQIPVKVIQGLGEEAVDANEEQAIVTPERETHVASVQQPTIEEQTHIESEPGFMMPLNIDDIVEMVKEHLDQAPKDVQPAPMELVLTNANEEKETPQVAIELLAQTPSMGLAEAPKPEIKMGTDEKKEASKTEQELTNIVVPIYQRNENNILKTKTSSTQTETEMGAPAIEAVAAKVVEIKPKMDARKRRFLFHADA